jgi:diguanylate cyclase (GGDEF)-like protein
MKSLFTIQSAAVPARVERARVWVWTFVPAFMLVHGIVATCLPEWLDPLSTVFIVLAEWTAIAACLGASRRAKPPARMFWFLLVGAIFLHSAAMSMDAYIEITHAPMLNHVPAISVLLSMLWGVPLLVAVSLQSDRRVLLLARLINTVLSLAVGALIYFEIFSFLTVDGSPNLSDAIRTIHMFDLLDVFLAVAASIRWLGSSDGQERRFYRVLTIFLWMGAILCAVHNRILLDRNWVWVDLLISAPYVLLVPLSLTRRVGAAKLRSPVFIRAVRTGSPIFLAGALVVAGVVVSNLHFYLGLSAALFAVAGYGAINILVLSRGLETEESLLASNALLEQMVVEDGLTGVANRRAMDERLERECARAHRTGQPVSLLMIDVDLFKELNDAAGHVAADDYLVQIATVMRETLARATDLVARYGGDEFAAILPATDRAGALIAAEKVRHAVASLALPHAALPGGIATVSIGISTFDGSMMLSPEKLTEIADGALYKAKRQGRNRAVFQPMENVNRVVPFPSVR